MRDALRSGGKKANNPGELFCKIGKPSGQTMGDDTLHGHVPNLGGPSRETDTGNRHRRHHRGYAEANGTNAAKSTGESTEATRQDDRCRCILRRILEDKSWEKQLNMSASGVAELTRFSGLNKGEESLIPQIWFKLGAKQMSK